MIFDKKYKERLNRGAEMVNEINTLYLKGESDKVDKIKRKLRKIKGVDLTDIIHRARTIRER